MDMLLQAQEVIDLARLPAHLYLKCLSGRLWVTCQGDRQDYLLKPGMEYRNEKRGKIVVCALTEARLCILNPATRREEAPLGQLLQI